MLLTARNAGLFALVLLGLTLILPGCSGDTSTLSGEPTLITLSEQSQNTVAAGLMELPVDKLQPREELDEKGFVIPGRTVSGVNQDSEFVPGVEHLNASLGITDVGEAVRLDSTTSGTGLCWAYWRLEMGGIEPGVVSADVNLMQNNALPSEYYLGVANYNALRWDWYGPFSDSHVRISTAAAVNNGASYLTGLGNTYVAIVAYDGACVEAVGVGANQLDPADTTPPPAPDGLTADLADGGVELQWNDVIAVDLAGYQIIWSETPITDPDAPTVERLNYLQGGRRCFLGPVLGQAGTKFVRVEAIDTAGNVSVPSTQVEFDFDPPAILQPLRLEANAPSLLLGEDVILTAFAGVQYDWDLDGDGVFDITGDTTGSQTITPTSTGIIRPSIRGTDPGGVCNATAAVSLIVSSNARPVARAYAIPASGPVPLNVLFTGEGWDGDGTIAHYDWDFDGDGTWDYSSDTDPNPTTAQEYTVAGMYNAKLRVEDDKGAFDVDSISILAETTGSGNTPPMAVLSHQVGEESGDTPHTVYFDFSGSSDAEGPIHHYYLDPEGDGMYQIMTIMDTYTFTYTSPGSYLPTLMVVDGDGATNIDQTTIEVNGSPVAHCVSDKYRVELYETFNLDASGSTDYENDFDYWEFDFDGDGSPDLASNDPYASHYYTTVGVWEIEVLVRDGDGAYDTTKVEITVVGWQGNTIDANLTDVVGTYCDLKVINGWPMVSYVDHTNNYVLFSRCTDADGMHPWVSPVVAATVPSTVGFTQLLNVDGHPAIAYADLVNQQLEYVRALDPRGDAWGTPVEINHPVPLASIGDNPSMAIVMGNPAIVSSGFDTSWDIMYVRANDPQGTTWGTPAVAVGGAGDQVDPCLKIVGGYPAISYYDSTLTHLRYCLGNDSGGSSWDPPVTVDASGNAGTESTIVIMDNKPAIVYLENGIGNVMFTIADDFYGTAWSGVPGSVSDMVGLKEGLSAAMVGDQLVISWAESSNGDLKYNHCQGGSGNLWGLPVTITDTSNYSVSTSICEVDGRVGIACHDNDFDFLSYWQLY